MIKRKYLSIVKKKLDAFPAVALLGPRQIGKTTLAQEIAKSCASLYLDLENYQDLSKLEDPVEYFSLHSGKLIILDEVHRKPDIFKVLRGLIDNGRRIGRRCGQFLLLGSASLDLLRQASESLAGRISYVEMGSVSVEEIDDNRADIYSLWQRGGFPDSFLADSDQHSIEWRLSFIKTYLERDIPQFGPRISAETLRRLWTMLAHLQGTLLNVSMLAKNLGLSGQTIARYIDLLDDLFLVRRLQPWHNNLKKRLVKSPKIYVRDSGILHSLLRINSIDDLLSNPIVGASWEGFVIDNLLNFLPTGSEAFFYRTARGAEVDLIINHSDGRTIAVEIKRSSSPKLQLGFYESCDELDVTHRFVVYEGDERFSLGKDVSAIGLVDLMQEIGKTEK